MACFKSSFKMEKTKIMDGISEGWRNSKARKIFDPQNNRNS